MRFRCYLEFQDYEDRPSHVESIHLEQVSLVITAESHSRAMTLALQFFDDYASNNDVKLRNINLYQQ